MAEEKDKNDNPIQEGPSKHTSTRRNNSGGKRKAKPPQPSETTYTEKKPSKIPYVITFVAGLTAGVLAGLAAPTAYEIAQQLPGKTALNLAYDGTSSIPLFNSDGEEIGNLTPPFRIISNVPAGQSLGNHIRNFIKKDTKKDLLKIEYISPTDGQYIKDGVYIQEKDVAEYGETTPKSVFDDYPIMYEFTR